MLHNNQSVTAHYAKHQLSFNQSYTERRLGVSRPHINESCLDPDYYLQLTYAENISIGNLEATNIMLKGWLVLA